jgi:hypothetical protein
LTTKKAARSGKVRPQGKADDDADFPFAESVGYQIRATHWALQRFLQLKIEPHGVTPGMWYFLRALWHEDGLNQRELSRRVGTMEPTTLSAILNMEKKGPPQMACASHPEGARAESRAHAVGQRGCRHRRAKSFPDEDEAVA